MRLLRPFLAVFCLITLLMPVSVLAADVLQDPCEQVPDAVACQGRNDEKPECNSLYGPCGVITKASQLVALLVGIAAVIAITIGGLSYVLSSGDPSRVNSAKNMILYAIIGLIVAVLAQSIVVFILKKL
jgi:hypothetical protein